VAILLVCLPVFMPVCLELGFGPLWFSMLICIVLQTSFLTPPFGYALFYFAGAAPAGKYHMMEIYKGVLSLIALHAIGGRLVRPMGGGGNQGAAQNQGLHEKQ
jgi:TRAP-type mannitol/chloroaromatic compound transport system permease large subunit